MRKLGVSVYPNHSSVEDIIDYLKRAASYGYSRIFTCLLSVDYENPQKSIDEFKKMTQAAHQLGFEVIGDVNPEVFKAFDLSIQDLSFFKEIGFDGIRLDMGFTGFEEALMTFDPSRLLIELNCSAGNQSLTNILSYQPNKNFLVGCHNFYPHRGTGLSWEHFLNTSRLYKEHNLRTAAFVNSAVADTGPWPVNEGLCTVERHRDWPIDLQARDLWQTNLIDDVIIGNAFASEEELAALAAVDPYCLSLTVELEADVSPVEKEIVLDKLHVNRGDQSEYFLRSSQSRLDYKEHDFVPHNNPPILHPGDVVIDNSLYPRYSGELFVVLHEYVSDGKANLVARIPEEEIFLLENIKPWQKFKLIEKQEDHKEEKK
ncbi:DUF871 domain-containing protein [Granulicatella seriolae]|uniref:MupG family TIM beta-alpha barrel fold protein n=1 Tax=Granulicatella seriolae TaxID=2967226 RepID=A0ABT1WQ37_9LACT|nr:MupG family TIM beta-alpha barrel fold protein [Granulicatella seriolae]